MAADAQERVPPATDAQERVPPATDARERVPPATDAPTFRWRGFMLDKGRHFMGKETVTALLDQMAGSYGG